MANVKQHDWYPKAIKVSERGTPSTYHFMKTVFSPTAHFSYAEFGIWKADTAANICRLFLNCTLYLFDFEQNIEAARVKLSEFPNRIHYFGNTQRYNDSYNWSLGKLIAENPRPIFDYCFLDGAHTWAVDALNYLLCDRLIRVGGYMDFDDYKWTLHGTSLDPRITPEIAQQYTDEQISTQQVAMIVDLLVKRDARYVPAIENKVYQKVA